MNASQTLFRLIALVLALATWVPAAASEPPLKERMSEEEFQAAGLHKLSEDELAALEAWLGSEEAERGDSGRTEPEDRRGLEESGARTPIESRIVGSFSGWSRGETFELENGMVWQVISDDDFYTPEVDNPRVEIRPGAFGSWRLHPKDSRNWARVRRID